MKVVLLLAMSYVGLAAQLAAWGTLHRALRTYRSDVYGCAYWNLPL